ncbi:MAG: hypothetical protein AAGJ83_06950 [Planctomycetota bacterium]
MLGQRTESLRSTLDQVPAWSAFLGSRRPLVWVAALVLLIVGVVFVSRRSPDTSMMPLFGDARLDELQILQYETAFSHAGLRGSVRSHQQILVPKEFRHEYLLALESAGILPFTQFREETSESLGSNLLLPQRERDRQRQQGRADQLGRRIASLPDVAWASVDYDEQEVGGFQPSIVRAASVIVVPCDAKPLSADRIAMIRELVRGAYAGMTQDEVTVTDTAAHKAYSGSEDPMMQKIRRAESDLERRLGQLLDAFDGIRIAATAVPHPLAETAVRSGDVKENRPAIASTTADDGKTPPPPLEMHVSIGIPQSHFLRLWTTQFRASNGADTPLKAPTAQQLTELRESAFLNIRDAVTPFLANANSKDSVQVWSYPDLPPGTNSNSDDATGSAWTPARLVQPSWAWIAGRFPRFRDYAAQYLFVIVPVGALLIIAACFFFAAFRKRGRTSDIRLPDAVAMTSETDADLPQATSTRKLEQGQLKEDLTELISSNPELAAQIVHRWVSDAA